MAEQALTASVQESLGLFQYDNAKFLGERLVALHNSEHNQQLLATCYMHCNQSYRAYHLLKGHNSQRSRYLLAVCCLTMTRYPEAKDALLKMGEAEIPLGYAGLYLLGKVCRLTNCMSEAKDYYFRALRLNPLLWAAYEELCAVGGDEEAAEVCSLAQLPPPAAAEGPSPSTSSQVSSALAHHTPHGQQQQQNHHGGHHHGRHGHPPVGGAKDAHHGRTAAQQHQPAGPAGTSAGGYRTGGSGGAGTGGFGFASFGVAGSGGQGPPTFGGGVGLGGGGGGSILFQTPQGQGQGGLFATPVPSFGGGGFGFGFGALPTGGVPASAQPGDGGAGSGVPANGGDGGAAAPPSTASHLFRFTGGGGGGGIFATPAPAGLGPQPPAPPQKHQQHALGQSEVPFPGFSAGPHGSGGGAAGPSGAPGHHAGTAAGSGSGHARISRMVDEGKVRKVSNKLFSDPRSSVRRSQRLAALNNATATTQAQGGPGAGGAGSGVAPQQQQQQLYPALYGGPSATASAVGQAKSGQASYVEGDSQNMPDPRDPPPAPVQQQLHPDAKLAAPQGAAAAATPQQLFAAFSGQLGARPGQGPADAPAPQQQLQQQLQGAAAMAESRAALLQLLVPLMEGVRHLAAYRCSEAVAALSRLPMGQYRTAWVSCALGRAHFESMNYQRAAQSFEQARQLDRTRVEGMEVYSTVLWHTKREYELSHLAQECVATDRLAPQTWCVMGNLFSGQKEHEAAIEFFLRAAQVDPTFTYAYTLAGHEYNANEDYDKAAACYRSALKLDPRHYNAMYGLGQIAFRQEKYGEALQNFRLAAGVNPRSSVLRCYVGMSAAKLGQHAVALEKLQEAIDLDPANPLARYERAAVLAAGERVGEALSELEALQRVAPGEASVAFQMGKLYKRLNNLTAAQQSFELALSYNGCSSSDAATIKAAIERLGLSEDEDEQEV